LVNNIPKSRKYTWTKESRTLKRKLEKRGNNDNKIKDFYWKRDWKINSIKAEFYDKNKFEETSKFIIYRIYINGLTGSTPPYTCNVFSTGFSLLGGKYK